MIESAMNPEQFRDALRLLGLSQRAFAREIGYRPNQVNAWAQGRYAIPVIVQKFLAQRLP